MENGIDDIYIEKDNQQENIRTDELPITTNTDMFVNDIANSEKLIPENQRQPYVKNAFHDKQNAGDNVEINEEHKEEEEYKEEQIKLSPEEERIQKMNYLRKLAELQASGIRLSQVYTINSNLETMKYEYELHKGIQDKKNGVTLMVNGLILGLNAMEYFNDQYNPFKLHLTGWTASINSEISNYYSIFEELYDKYTRTGKGLQPEIKLLFALSFSAFTFHLANTLAGKMPDLNIFGKDNPELLNRMRQQAVNDTQLKQKTENAHNEANTKVSEIDMIRKRELEQLEIEKNMNQLKIKPPTDPFIKQFTIQQQEEIDEHKIIQETNKINNKNISNPKTSVQMVNLAVNKKRPSVISSNISKISESEEDETSSVSTISYNPNIEKIMENVKKKKTLISPEKIPEKYGGGSIDVSDEELHKVSISIGDEKKKKSIKRMKIKR